MRIVAEKVRKDEISPMASKSNSSDAKAGPSAFGIKLGISTGGSSPDQDADRYTVMVSKLTQFMAAVYGHHNVLL